MKRRVVITGMGAVSPVGDDTAQLWRSVCEGVSGIRPITAFDTTYNPVKVAAEVRDWHPERFIDPQSLRHNARFMQFARVAAQQAYQMSGLAEVEIDRDRCGVYISSSVGGIEAVEKVGRSFRVDAPSRVPPYLIPNVMLNLASGAVAIDLQARGRNMATASACASGANAIGEAFRVIQWGEQDIMVAGAADAAITPLSLAGFAAMRAMYIGDDPDRASIPFDAERSGTVMGEGAGVLVLEELEHARARHASIIAEIVGYGTNCDAYSIATPESEGRSIGRAMQLALDDAGVTATAIDYINAHGTSTVLNDKTEALAIHRVFGESTEVPVSSTKSMTGHMLGAGGAVEAIITANALQDGMIPPTIHYRVPDPDCRLNIVTKCRQSPLQYALTNSFGFGGHNACLVLKKWPS